MKLRRPMFALFAAVAVLTGCSSSSPGAAQSSSSTSTETNPFTSSIIANPDPAAGTTDVAADSAITLRFFDSVGAPFSMGDARLFHIVLVQAVVTNSDTGVIYATASDRSSVWQDDTTLTMLPDDAMQCNANYSINVKVRVEESKDSGTTWQVPGFGSLEETEATTFKTGSSYC